MVRGGDKPLSTLWSNKVQVISSGSFATPKGERIPLETFHLRTQERLRGEPITVYMSMVTFLKHLGSPLLKILKFGIRVGFVETRIVFKCE